MTAFKRELRISGTAADLPKILSFVETACEQAGIDPALQLDVQLAVEEACCNVFEHAYGGESGDLHIALAAHGRDLAITLQDHGRPFDPAQVAPLDTSVPLEERRVGGLGLHLMCRLMDEVRFTFAKGINKLVMVKRNALLPDVAHAPPENPHA